MNELSWKPNLPMVVESQVALHSPKHEMRRGLWIAGAFFVGVLGWASYIALDAGAMASGVVAVSGSRQLVQHRDGGIITDIAVVEGQHVKKGDMLVKISAPELVASERGMASELVTLLAQRARLTAELSGSRIVATPAEFASLAGDDRQLADVALQSQRRLFYARRSTLNVQRDVLGQRVRQQDAQIGAFDSQITANRKQRALIGDELQGMNQLVDRGFVAINRIRATERAAAELDGNDGALRADILKAHESIGEARLQIASLDQQLVQEAATQMNEVQLRLDELQPKLTSTREMLKLASVRAPATGRIVGLKIHTVGGVVRGGETLMEVLPDERALVVEAKAMPNDADDLRVGMDTQVRFSALQERNLPVLHGQISKLSADSIEDERTGTHYFAIEVTVPQAELAKIREVRGNAGIKAGLPAEVLIPLRKRTALTYLLEPLTQMLWRSGREH